MIKTFQRDSLQFPYIDSGPSDTEAPLVLLHGFPATFYSWNAIRERLVAEGKRVIIPELRGYADTALPSGRWRYRIKHFIDDFRALLDAETLQRVHLVGHDWGGLVGWALLSQLPRRIRSFTAIASPHPRVLLSPTIAAQQVPRSWYMAAVQLPALPEALLSARDGTLLRRLLARSGLSSEFIEAYVNRLLRSRRHFAGALNSYRGLPLSPDFLFSTAAPRGQCLLITPTEDRFLHPAAMRATANLLGSSANVVEVPGPHWLPEEKPDLLASLISRFLERL